MQSCNFRFLRVAHESVLNPKPKLKPVGGLNYEQMLVKLCDRSFSASVPVLPPWLAHFSLQFVGRASFQRACIEIL